MIRIFTLSSLLLLVISFNAKATVCSNIATGNWSNTSNWSCGSLPIGGDTVVITASTIESFDMGNYTMPGGSRIILKIYGTLLFTAGSKLNMPAGSNIILYAGGSIKGAGGGGNSNFLAIGGTTVWRAGDGNKTGPLVLNTGCLASTGGCALPVTLISFAGKYSTSSQQIALNWFVGSETQFSYYEIWKSYDGKSFYSVDRITGVGAANTTVQYNYNDNTANLLNTNYYKLKQVDLNGSYTFSEIIAVNTENNEGLELSISPNPALSGDYFEIIIAGAGSSGMLKIADISGQLVFSKTFNFIERSSVIGFTSEEKLMPGTYIATVIGEGVASTNKKFIIW